MANISTITYGGSVLSETEEAGDVVVTYDGRTLANITAGETKNILCNGKVMKTNLYIGGKTLLCEMAQMISDIVVAVKSAFPEAPTAYDLISRYTASQTWTAPEDGYYQIEVFGASGNGGATNFLASSGGAGIATGGGGGGGGIAVSRIKMKKGDTIVINCGAVGETTIATINSSIESYSVLQVTSGTNGTDGVVTSALYSATAGTGGAGGVASGGNDSNVNGNLGGNGNAKTKCKTAGEVFAGGIGGTSAISGGNVGGTAQMVTVTKKWMSGISSYYYEGEISGGTSGSAGFIKIYRGNTNEVGISSILGNNSWKNIVKIAKEGKSAEYWSVGDTKSIEINGTAYTAQIIGFDHDDVADSASYGRSKAGITFQLVECYTQQRMQAGGSNTGGWGACEMRSSYIPTYLAALPMSDYLVTVKKPYCATSSSSDISYAEDKLFLLSEQEIFGAKTYAPAAEGTQYAYYALGNSKVKNYNGSATNWWTRSASNRFGSNYVRVDASGASNDASADSYQFYGVAFAFCV